MTGFVSSHWLPSNRRIRHIFNTTKKNKWFRCQITLWCDTSCYGLEYVCFSHTAEPACGLVGKYRSACGDLFMGTGSPRQWPDSFMTSCAVRRWGHFMDSFGRDVRHEWWEHAADLCSATPVDTHTLTDTGPPRDSHGRPSWAQHKHRALQ